MMTKIKPLLMTFGLLILMTGCDRPVCQNTNSILDKFPPDAREYKDELVKQLADINKTKLSYWLDRYMENNGTQSLLVDVQGAGLCAKMFLIVKESDKGIEDLIKGKGIGYRGAELEDLMFDIRQDSVSTEFIFKETAGIAD